MKSPKSVLWLLTPEVVCLALLGGVLGVQDY